MSLPTPQPSALQTLLQTHQLPPTSPHSPHLHHLALQVAHNLHFQHGWKDVRVHYQSTASGSEGRSLPRPILSGLPPKRLYVHPDEQVEVLQRLKIQRESAGSEGGEGKGVGMGMRELEAALKREREWVLPSHLREKWSLWRFGEVFDCVGAVPGTGEGEVVFEEGVGLGGEMEGGGLGGEDVIGEGVSDWRTQMPKRLLLATLDDDSTVVYYIVHDGIVKPRQN